MDNIPLLALHPVERPIAVSISEVAPVHTEAIVNLPFAGNYAEVHAECFQYVLDQPVPFGSVLVAVVILVKWLQGKGLLKRSSKD